MEYGRCYVWFPFFFIFPPSLPPVVQDFLDDFKSQDGTLSQDQALHSEGASQRPVLDYNHPLYYDRCSPALFPIFSFFFFSIILSPYLLLSFSTNCNSLIMIHFPVSFLWLRSYCILLAFSGSIIMIFIMESARLFERHSPTIHTSYVLLFSLTAPF